ncbi:hypothetical protein D3C71_1646160 [compost metagenome]
MVGQRRGADVQPLAHDGRHQRHGRVRSQRGDALKRLRPRVQGQIERAVVDGHEVAAFHILVGLQAFVGLHVDVGPLRVVGAGLDHRQVKRTIPLANGLEPVKVARVTAEEDAHLGSAFPRHQHPRRPQRAVAV